jgi:hypothetical protein
VIFQETKKKIERDQYPEGDEGMLGKVVRPSHMPRQDSQQSSSQQGHPVRAAGIEPAHYEIEYPHREYGKDHRVQATSQEQPTALIQMLDIEGFVWNQLYPSEHGAQGQAGRQKIYCE